MNSSCMQTHGSDAYSIRKKKNELGLNASQTKHDANNHRTYACKRKVQIVREGRFMSVNLKGAFAIWYSLLYYCVLLYTFPLHFCRQISRPLPYNICISSKANVVRLLCKSHRGKHIALTKSLQSKHVGMVKPLCEPK